MPAPLCSSIEFGAHRIAYDDRVLEPRPWTTLQSDWAAELSASAPGGPILELCSGAGQIGIAAAASTGRPLVQVDSNPVACEFARSNAESAGLSGRVTVRCADLAAATDAGDSFPIVLADPPYLPTDSVDRYPDDPVRAIDGGVDGRSVLRACVQVIDRVLPPDGLALVQVHGAAQAEALGSELPDGLRLVAVRAHDDDRAVALLGRVDGSQLFSAHQEQMHS